MLRLRRRPWKSAVADVTGSARSVKAGWAGARWKNLAWSWIFFKRHALGAAAAEIVVLWATIGATTMIFGRIQAIAAWLMLPYLAWVRFAALLNVAYWRLHAISPELFLARFPAAGLGC